MFITVDILQQRGACQEYLNFFQKHFPNGAELSYLIERGHLPYHGLHWGYKWLDPNEEEVAMYWKKVHVENSEGVDESDHVTNSCFVGYSSKVTNSENVYHSKEIIGSKNIFNSEMVDNSERIGESYFVNGSRQIVKSKNISDSVEVCKSEFVMESYGVYQGNNIVNGIGIWRSNNLTTCGLCADCKNLSNSLFCYGVEGEYLLFNKPIDKTRFDMISKQFVHYQPKLSLTEEWKDNSKEIPQIIQNYSKHFQNTEKSFWAWVRTLPGYDEEILYNITLNPIFLA